MRWFSTKIHAKIELKINCQFDAQFDTWLMLKIYSQSVQTRVRKSKSDQNLWTQINLMIKEKNVMIKSIWFFFLDHHDFEQKNQKFFNWNFNSFRLKRQRKPKKTKKNIKSKKHVWSSMHIIWSSNFFEHQNISNPGFETYKKTQKNTKYWDIYIYKR